VVSTPPEREWLVTDHTVARRIAVDGTVQGVGFRPFVWRLASQLRLAGTVRNVGGRVEIMASGSATRLDALATRLRTEAPPRARVRRITVTAMTVPADLRPGFIVCDSDETAPAGADRLFPPDLATCDACVGELFTPGDRRFRYPFINCTDCGPRATIIDSLPYDRGRTTMADFPMCPGCRTEYRDPADRRFHAEPIACPACGPRLAWRPADPATGRADPVTAAAIGPGAGAVGEAALRAAVAALAGGGIVAVKGLGGYHLACDATDEAAVRRLRERKHRWAKPLAVMVGEQATAHRYAALGPAAVAELTGPARPIVLARYALAEAPAGGRGTAPLAPAVLAGLPTVGLFLPYTGLHHLLLAALARPIVLTSGNRSDEPIAVDDCEALARLGDIADGFLTHDRRIRSRYEDSVVTVVRGGPVLLRRGRGYAPEPIDLPVPAAEPVLGVGAQLKHTFAIARGARAHLAGHTGDLSDLATLEAYRHNLAHLRRLLDAEPRWVAHDPHPAYLSTQEAAKGYPASRRIPVQHHHAHVAACMAEHGLTGPVVGVALDGLGMGDDQTFWGGEVLVADLLGYRRVGRFGRAPMPGGEAAVRQPWRMALGYLFGAEDLSGVGVGVGVGVVAGPEAVRRHLSRFEPRAVEVIRRQIGRRLNAPVASSAGRLFDAASSILGLRDVAAYEGEAAIVLQHAADPDERGELPWRLVARDGLSVYDPRPTLAALLAGVAAGVPVPALAARFQGTVAAAVTALATGAARGAGLDVVCLSGGVFGNEWLLAEVPRRLADAGLTALFHRRVPPGDGGISLGQVAVAAARLAAPPPHPPGGEASCA
jgi:hydrogenase maturation protein HypF